MAFLTLLTTSSKGGTSCAHPLSKNKTPITRENEIHLAILSFICSSFFESYGYFFLSTALKIRTGTVLELPIEFRNFRTIFQVLLHSFSVSLRICFEYSPEILGLQCTRDLLPFACIS